MKGDRRSISQLTLVLFLSSILLITSSEEVTAENDDEAYFSPDALSVGTVYRDCVIEANFSINHVKKVYSVDHPPWITIREIKEDTSYRFASCDIYLTVNTSQTGNFSGEVVVETDNGVVTLPVSVSVRNSPDPSVKLLITDTIFERSSTSDSSLFKEVTGIITENYIDVDYRERIPSDLSAYDVILVAEGALWNIAGIEVRYLHHFINNGGTVIVCADPFFIGTVCSANEIITPYGLRMKNEDICEEFILDKGDILSHEVTEGIDRIRIYRPSLIYTTGDEGKILVKNPENPHEGFVAISEHNGAVIVFGNSLWWLNLAKSTEYDNNRFFGNMLTYVTPPPSFFNSPLSLRIFMILIIFIFMGYLLIKKALYKKSIKDEHKFFFFLLLFTIIFYIRVFNEENTLIVGLSISLLFFPILFSLILIKWKKVIIYLFLSALIIGALAVTFEGEYTLRETLPWIKDYIFINILLYTFCLLVSLFPVTYNKKRKDKSRFTLSVFLSWVVAYSCIAFFNYLSGSYDTLLETATFYAPLFVSVVVTSVIVYLIYDIVMRQESEKSPQIASEMRIKEMKK